MVLAKTVLALPFLANTAWSNLPRLRPFNIWCKDFVHISSAGSFQSDIDSREVKQAPERVRETRFRKTDRILFESSERHDS